MSLLNKTSATDHPSREAVLDHVDEAKENKALHHDAMESAQKGGNRLKQSDSSDQIFSK